YSYPAALRVEARCHAAAVPLQWRPFLLCPIFAAQGWNDSPFNIYPIKGRYMWRDLERLCGEYGLPLRRPSVFPRNGLLAARIACVAAGGRLCGEYGFPLRRPSVFPRTGLLAARIACVAAGETWLASFVRAVYRANFAEDRDIAHAT